MENHKFRSNLTSLSYYPVIVRRLSIEWLDCQVYSLSSEIAPKAVSFVNDHSSCAGPTTLASAGESSPAQTPPAHRRIFPSIQSSLYVLLSSAYPFPACSFRQPFVSTLRKGTPYPFPISTLFEDSSLLGPVNLSRSLAE